MGTIPPLTLRAETVAELMTTNPISLRDNAPVADAVALLNRKGFHAAPVIDETGRPVGVLSYTDILAHERRQDEDPSPTSENICARDLMTPAVFSLPADAPARRVVSDMVALSVHQLFVVDKAGVLVGVVSALDVLRRLSE